MPLRSSLEPTRIRTGDLCVEWRSTNGEDGQISLRMSHELLWATVPGVPFLATTDGKSDVRESRGFFTIRDSREPFTDIQTLDHIGLEDETIVLDGELLGRNSVPWQLRIRILGDGQIRFTATVRSGATEPRLLLRYGCDPEEKFFGFGEQFTHLDLKGHRLDILSQEPGIGRGIQPLTWFMNRFGAGGDDTRSNAPVPHYITSQRRSLCLENHELSRFDLREREQVEIELWSDTLVARLFYGDSPARLISAYTEFCGRMAPLPDWIHTGAIVGMQGGTAAVRERLRRLEKAGAPISAFWLQDWVGIRKTSAGSQLWWNWELDGTHYPQWEALGSELADRNIHVLSYINPFLVDAADREQDCRRNLFREALELGFLVHRVDGSPYLVRNTSFSAAMVDLTHPEARRWLKDVIRSQVLSVGASGWMADFGEALPFDAVLHDGSDPAQFHNVYPEAWARLNREAIEEAGRDGEVVFFTRSGFTRSPGLSTLFWLGDQLTSWRAEDGIRSALTGLLSSGFCGFSQNHSDIGGYTTTAIPGLPFRIPLLDFRRSKELLLRWIELNAFTAVFRTHEGNQPLRNHQIDADEETIEHFAKFARVYAALAELRIELGREASENGLPVVRHPWLCFPQDSNTVDLKWQFMLGDSMMVAPVLDRARTRVDIYLPKGRWTHLWSDQSLDLSDGGWVEVDAPLGAPAVFLRADNEHGVILRKRLDATGDRSDWVGRTMIIDTKKNESDTHDSPSVGRQAPEQSLKKTIGRVALGVGFFFLVVVVLGVLFEGRLLDICGRAVDRFGIVGLGTAVFFVDLVPTPASYAWFMFVALAGEIPLGTIFLVSSLASYVSGLVGYGIGRSIGMPRRLETWLDSKHPRIRRLLDRHGVWGLAAIAILPLPLSIGTWLAGALKMNPTLVAIALLMRLPKTAVYLWMMQAGLITYSLV